MKLNKSDIDTIVDWIYEQSNDGKIDIHNSIEFEKDFRNIFREMHKLNCKNIQGDRCLLGGYCNSNCRRMKKYDKNA